MAVSSKKDTLIDDAQKFALRGQLDKAVKAYEQILKLDPAAINLRQKLAELLIKCGRNDDARKEFETVGIHFSKNGFYLKAIAVYKQLQKLFPEDISLSLTLAELNEKYGLVANSLSEYRLVYEFHNKAGNIPEAIRILDRMQNVDPQNIPIKIKLAEALIQLGKKDESYAVFAKATSMLLERNDTASLTKVCARIQQLFPDKPDFLLEVLTGQVNQGNAASAIGSLQNLLRSDPNNKDVWELTARAYQLLEQPQRAKIAYQHYLKRFPAEPAAMLGLISSFTVEQNIVEAVELLDRYEEALISAGFLQELEQVYHSLDKIDPISTRVLQGLIRVATASGNESEVHSLTSRLKSLHAVSGNAQGATPLVGAPPSKQTTAPDSGAVKVEFTPETVRDAGSSTASTDSALQSDEDIEIDIEIDVDNPLESSDQEITTASTGDNWLDSIGNLFDSIDTVPRGVRFGNEMENSDAQSHFDLGQAFKEMGLYDEAINEFRQASLDASRRVECLILQCVCLRERGELEKAMSMLQALLKTGLSIEASCAVKYELATGYEAAGKKDDAHFLLNEIYAINPGFRDIGSRLNAANTSESLDFSDEDLQDF
ncbi:MAG: tetratricopeptide repeat protein [Desulfuromonadaceae bacterium]